VAEEVIDKSGPNKGRIRNRLIIRYLRASLPRNLRTGTSGRAFAPERRACQKKLHKNLLRLLDFKKHSISNFSAVCFVQIIFIFFKINSKKNIQKRKISRGKKI